MKYKKRTSVGVVKRGFIIPVALLTMVGGAIAMIVASGGWAVGMSFLIGK